MSLYKPINLELVRDYFELKTDLQGDQFSEFKFFVCDSIHSEFDFMVKHYEFVGITRVFGDIVLYSLGNSEYAVYKIHQQEGRIYADCLNVWTIDVDTVSNLLRFFLSIGGH